MKQFLVHTHILFLFLLVIYIVIACFFEIKHGGAFEIANLLSLAGSLILYTGIHVYILSYILMGAYVIIRKLVTAFI